MVCALQYTPLLFSLLLLPVSRSLSTRGYTNHRANPAHIAVINPTTNYFLAYFRCNLFFPSAPSDFYTQCLLWQLWRLTFVVFCSVLSVNSVVRLFFSSFSVYFILYHVFTSFYIFLFLRSLYIFTSVKVNLLIIVFCCCIVCLTLFFLIIFVFRQLVFMTVFSRRPYKASFSFYRVYFWAFGVVSRNLTVMEIKKNKNQVNCELDEREQTSGWAGTSALTFSVSALCV